MLKLKACWATRLATNIIVSSMLILGGSATVTDLTGMHTIAVSVHVSCHLYIVQQVSSRPASLFLSASRSTSL